MDLTQLNTLIPTHVDTKIIKNAISRINTGRAILFTGAGFSFGCKNILGEEPPLASGLAKRISILGEFEEDDDLSYVSDFYLSHRSKSDLLKLLKENYSISTTQDSHKKISSVKWKKIYTTNYDDVLEKSSYSQVWCLRNQ